MQPDPENADDADHPDLDALALLDATRDLADHVWRSLAPPATRASVAAAIARLTPQLEPLETATPVVTPIGARLPGRGHPLLPPMIRNPGDGRTLGTVTYTSAHVGGGDAVHGGQIALLFDEVLGGVAATEGMNRTASITVNFRSLTPLYTALTVEGWVDRVEGRKVYVQARLLDGERVCADAEALFVTVDGWA